MSAIGPTLPPHLLAKRKRQQEEDQGNAPTTNSGAKPTSSPDAAEKRRRVIGPAMPPAPLDQKPLNAAVQGEEGSDDSDDDFGPSLPTNGASTETPSVFDDGSNQNDLPISSRPSPPPEKLRRDDWMMVPPKQDDLAARLDPSKPRPRTFNTGKGARGGSTMDDDNSAWHETPEQKRKRLENEMMGITKAPEVQSTAKYAPSREESSRRKEQTKEKSREPSLLERHQQSKGKEVDDDPSKRAFDREKDMASGGRISSTQRKDLLNRAGNFGSKFSKGGLL